MSKGDSYSVRVLLLGPLLVFGMMALLEPTDFARRLENLTVDWRFRSRAAHDPEADSRILLVGIGDYSLKRLGRWEDWTRDIHGAFSTALTNRPPAVLAWDFFFSEKSRKPENDVRFADALAFHPGAITGAVCDSASHFKKAYTSDTIGKTRPITKVEGDRSAMLGSNNGQIPIDIIAESSWTGFVNAAPSRIDGVRRKIPLLVNFAGEIYPSLVLQIMIQLEQARSEDVSVKLGESIRIPKRDGSGDWVIPVDQGGFMWINYRNTQSFQKCDYVKLIEDLDEFAKSGRWMPDYPGVENQIILVGQMAEGLADFGPSPYRMEESLVLIQASALNNILLNDYLKVPSPWPFFLGWLVVGWLTLWLLRGSSLWVMLAVPLALMAGYILLARQLMWSANWWIPLFLPVVGTFVLHGAIMVNQLASEMKAKREIRSLFGAYAGRELVERIISTGEKPRLGGEKAEITVFFSDVAGFSSFSEELSPERLVSLMIAYMSDMTEILMDRGGVLDKYVGDSIVGMFGVLVPLKDHSYRAVTAAIEMQKRQYQLREKWRETGDWPDSVYGMQTRIGLNTGEAVIGNMGSRQRFNFTMMGDTVNLASRCESGAKTYGVYTMVTESTRSAAMKVKDDIAYRYLDKIVVAGRAQPVSVYEIIGYKGDLSPSVSDCLWIYGEGMKKYLAQDWTGAAELFQKSALIEPSQPEVHAGVKTNPSLLLLQRCTELKKSPPNDDWDGIYLMKSK